MTGDELQAKTLTTEEAEARWAQIVDQVEEMWSQVIEVVNNILHAHTQFGFSSFAENITPSLDVILFSLKVVESVLDTVDASGTLEYSETRKVGNAKQQILWIQTIGNALKYRNETDYLASIEKLGNQSGH